MDWWIDSSILSNSAMVLDDPFCFFEWPQKILVVKQDSEGDVGLTFPYRFSTRGCEP